MIVCFKSIPFVVEMGGFEPPSKQRIQKFSTRLAHIFLSGGILPAGGPYSPYLLKSYCKAGESLQPAPRR